MTEAAGLQADLQWRRGDLQIDFDAMLPPRGITALFGPSGAGKTSCLRAIAGLDQDVGGSLRFAGETWQDSDRKIFMPPHRRRIGYVFQEPSLFPHLSVVRNLDFGYRRAGKPSRVERSRLIDDFGLQALLGRDVASLSGGERQRVAIVRALLSDPVLLLMDEPLAALDHRARLALLAALESLHARLSIPVVYVSHAIEEVTRLADHLLLMESGRIVAQGPLQETLTRLDLPPAFTESLGTIIEGTVIAHDGQDHVAELDIDGGRLFLSRAHARIGERLRCRIAARDVTLMLQPQTDATALNSLRCIVTAIGRQDSGGQCLVQLAAGSNKLLAQITERSRSALDIVPGKALWAQAKAVALGE